jgi:molybdopterin-biosynthesis enzyme MoeA-like protein
MLLTPSKAEERVFHFVRASGGLRATADDIARQTQCDVQDARHVLDELVQRNLLRRFDVPGERPVYWT